ncbi:MAG: CAP domain-containing protein [Pseudomonadota bacterium]
MRVVRMIGLLFASFLMVACSTNTTATTDASSNATQAFRITNRIANQIPERHLNLVNEARLFQGLPALTYSPELEQAALVHAQNIQVQQRAWHFGTDGSNPIERAQRAGFTGALVGENLSETYENDTVTLQAWLADPNSRSIILDPNARTLAIAWFQEPNAKIWWVQMIGQEPQLIETASDF